MKKVNYKKIKLSPGRNEAKTSIFVLVVIAGVLILAAVQLVISHRLATTGSRIRHLEEQTHQLQAANQQLREELGRVASLSKIAVKAEQLGLQREPDVVYLPSQVSVALK